MKLSLPDVTLCAVTSVNVEATVAALRHSLSLAEFGDCILLTDRAPKLAGCGIRSATIPRLDSSSAYSRFVLEELPEHIMTGHCLLIQWDGFVLDPAKWTPAFLDYDYIGAPWPQFADGHDVGNGGFSLRSRRLMDACREPGFRGGHPEDVLIGRTNRTFLEGRGMRFADRSTAERFSCERDGDPRDTFGFHGVFRMIEAVGPDRFWSHYRTLDERSTVWNDLRLIMRQLGNGKTARARRRTMLADRIRDGFSRLLRC